MKNFSIEKKSVDKSEKNQRHMGEMVEQIFVKINKTNFRFNDIKAMTNIL